MERVKYSGNEEEHGFACFSKRGESSMLHLKELQSKGKRLSNYRRLSPREMRRGQIVEK